MKISETDFNQLSALIDDELNADDKAQVLERLQSEEALQQTFVELQQLKYSMQASYKQTLVNNTNKPLSRAPSYLKHWSAAAVIGVSCLMIGALVSQRDFVDHSSTQGLLALHQSFVQGNYPVSQRNPLDSIQQVANHAFILPDLSASNLYLVAQQSDVNSEQVMHYRGVNGCKLTLRVQGRENAQLLQSVSQEIQQYQWFVADKSYQLIATGMDIQRFSAISEYIQHLSNKVLVLDKYQVAMKESYQTAAPCV